MRRQLELGMQPIQQGFSGYVPRSFAKKFPYASLKQETQWVGFEGTMQLDPTDPMFKAFGSAFLETQAELFGAHGFYAADPFHEGDPPTPGDDYLNEVGKSVINLLVDFDENAQWVMQAWSIREAIATAVPIDRLLILDLDGSKYLQHSNFWGYRFVTGNLHNFGGRINMHGDMQLVASNQRRAALQAGANVVGSGLFMEAVGQNPFYYDLAFEMPFHSGSIDTEGWTREFADRRYGMELRATRSAWLKLLKGPYRPGTNGVENSSIVAARPAIDVKKSGPNAGFDIPYEPRLLIDALDLLLSEAGHLADRETYAFDLVDIKRQILSNLGQEIHSRAMQAYRRQDVDEFKFRSQQFLELLDDLDAVLATRDEFSFEKWIGDARRWGHSPQEADLYEYNASMLVTIWGPFDNPQIFDYSWREWSGLIRQYYKPRWQMFFEMLEDSLISRRKYSEEGLPKAYGREAFRANAFYQSMAKWELNWVRARKDLTDRPMGSSVQKVRLLRKKYAPLFDDYYSLQ